MSKKEKGNRGEALARAFLTKHGFTVVARNFRIDGGEIDLIANHAEIYIFVEVKYRSSGDWKAALEQITPAQCGRIRFTAQHYLLQHGLNQHQLTLRFDVITVTGDNAEIFWLKDAF